MTFLKSPQKVSRSRSCLSTNTLTHTDSSSPQFVVPVMNAYSFCLLECKKKKNLASMQSWHFILVSLWKSSHSNSLTWALLKEIKFYSVKLCLDLGTSCSLHGLLLSLVTKSGPLSPVSAGPEVLHCEVMS